MTTFEKDSGVPPLSSPRASLLLLLSRPLDLLADAMCHKRQYTKREANAAINRRMRGRSERRRGRPDYLRVYHCPNCNWWHLTSQELR